MVEYGTNDTHEVKDALKCYQKKQKEALSEAESEQSSCYKICASDSSVEESDDNEETEWVSEPEGLH